MDTKTRSFVNQMKQLIDDDKCGVIELSVSDLERLVKKIEEYSVELQATKGELHGAYVNQELLTEVIKDYRIMCQLAGQKQP